jgi:hypothetical protein
MPVAAALRRSRALRYVTRRCPSRSKASVRADGHHRHTTARKCGGILVASWEERRAWRDEFRSLGVELVRDRVRLAAWDDEKLQEARRWLWWQEHLVTIIVIAMGGAVAIVAALIGLIR